MLDNNCIPLLNYRKNAASLNLFFGETIMKKLFIFCVLIFGSHAKAADPVESIDPIASTPQVIVVY